MTTGPNSTAANTGPISLTRQELYELVWSEPMRTLAKRYGISDVALGKTCRKHRIPRPWRGYWQRKRHGKSVRQTPLKPLADDEQRQLGTITLAPRRRRKPAEKETGPVADQKKYETEHPIAVPEYILRLHPLVREIQEHCRDSEGSRSSRWGRRQAQHAAVDVGSESLPRALRILDTLIRALEERGIPMAVEREDDTLRIFAATNGTRLGVRLEERRKQVEIPPSASDLALSNRYSWRAEPRKELQYTGGRERFRQGCAGRLCGRRPGPHLCQPPVPTEGVGEPRGPRPEAEPFSRQEALYLIRATENLLCLLGAHGSLPRLSRGDEPSGRSR